MYSIIGYNSVLYIVVWKIELHGKMITCIYGLKGEKIAFICMDRNFENGLVNKLK